jgi:hypothetical protein
MSSPVEHALATPFGQQAAQRLPSPHTEQEALQQPLRSPPKDKVALQQPLPLSLTPKVKEASPTPVMPPPLSSTTEIEAPKDKEASPVLVMPSPLSSPYDTIHEDLALDKTKLHSNPMDQLFVTMRNLMSPPGTSSAMSGN